MPSDFRWFAVSKRPLLAVVLESEPVAHLLVVVPGIATVFEASYFKHKEED